MLKKIAFLVKRGDLSVEQFREHWRNTHGVVVSQSPGYARYRVSYAQNHPVGPTAFGQPFAWSGMAEFELPGESGNEDHFATTSIYRDRIAVDERRFIDMDATVSFTAAETRVAIGQTGIKVVLVTVPLAGGGMTAAEVAELTLADPGVREAVVGWTANEVLTASFRMPGAREAGDPGVSAVHELWLDEAASVLPVTARIADMLAEAVDVDGSWSFVAEQLVFFVDGRPVDPFDA